MAHHRMGRHRAEMAQAAIRSDRGGGTMTVNGSEAVCIEGLNSLKLTNCDLTGNMQDLSQNDCTWNVILYQSMSGGFRGREQYLQHDRWQSDGKKRRYVLYDKYGKYLLSVRR